MGPTPTRGGWGTFTTWPGSETYLVGRSYESEDVHGRVGPHVVTEQGVEMGDGRQGAVFVGHAV